MQLALRQECREFRASILQDMRSNGHDWRNYQSCFLWLKKWGARQKQPRHLRGQMSKYNFCGLVPNSTFPVMAHAICCNPKCWATRHHLIALATAIKLAIDEISPQKGVCILAKVDENGKFLPIGDTELKRRARIFFPAKAKD